ncbi:SET domain-containing protein [Neocallimastix californiae]|uniref:SET domain-containing protein n=1 Tax=Neocallimastix californiae TaxID=1754190 RepID=A0A1Y2AI29_9FUNG|nr:SET domain-containing protein [Neocallimastix californiae]|eukprot:ORY22166.1 SET domain-containing protein [Neocallimastix californiae]
MENNELNAGNKDNKEIQSNNKNNDNQQNNNNESNNNEKSSTKISANEKVLSFLHQNSKNSVLEEAQKTYIHIENNEFIGNATGNVTEIGDYMPCMCKYRPDVDDPEMACGEESGCINRAVLIECANDCPCGKYCRNKRFQRKEYAQVEVFQTEKKGYGLRTLTPLKPGQFVMEYAGEIITYSDFLQRTQEYSKEGLKHFYFMSLKKDEMIDATRKGNLARFMNHSCNPNCELQKWVVGSRLRMGLFTLRNIEKNEELTFDYQFERYGNQAQPCYCGEPCCTGFIGGNKKSDLKSIMSEEPEKIDIKPKKSHRGRKSADFYDNDYVDPFSDDMLENGKSQGMDYLDDIPKFVRLMFNASKTKHVKKLLRRIEMTTSQQSLRTFMRFHGLSVLKIWIRTYKSELSLCEYILEILKKLPYSSKNLVTDLKLEDVIKPLCDSPEKNIASLSKELIDMWSQLHTVYKIPKLEPSEIKVNYFNIFNNIRNK